MWPLLLLGLVAGGGVAYAISRPTITAPRKPPRGARGGVMVTWGSTGTDHWYPSLEAVADDAARLGDSGVLMRGRKLAGHVDKKGNLFLE